MLKFPFVRMSAKFRSSRRLLRAGNGLTIKLLLLVRNSRLLLAVFDLLPYNFLVGEATPVALWSVFRLTSFAAGAEAFYRSSTSRSCGVPKINIKTLLRKRIRFGFLVGKKVVEDITTLWQFASAGRKVTTGVADFRFPETGKSVGWLACVLWFVPNSSQSVVMCAPVRNVPFQRILAN